MIAWLRRHWLATLYGGVSLLGVPLAYFAGDGVARLELRNLERTLFQIPIEAAQPFEDLYVKGSGLMVTVVCGEEFGIHVEGAPENLFVQQRSSKRLVLSAQQIDSAQRIKVLITTPMRAFKIDVRNGAKAFVPSCAVNRSHLTLDLSGGSELRLSGETADLFLFVSTGSKLLAGEQGPLLVEQAHVEMVLGAYADLCGADSVLGNVAVSSKLKIQRNIKIRGMRETTLLHGCAKLVKEDSA